MTPFLRRLLAASTALVVLALVLGGVMRERCLMNPGTCCCQTAILALVDASPSASASCMAPAGPEVGGAEVASRWQNSPPDFFVAEGAVTTRDLPVDAQGLAWQAPFRSDPVPLPPQNRVLRI